tara:strand:+ start:6458 stop:6832 length:375 start_codon:yes stop_codon:yes gene_type:complete
MTQITGMIKVIKETERVSEKFSKRNFVVTTNEMYPQDVQMQITQDKCALLDAYKEMDQVVVDINIRGREWINPEGKSIYFVSLEAWKITKTDESKKTPKVQGNIEKRFEDEAIDSMTEDDDLPF